MEVNITYCNMETQVGLYTFPPCSLSNWATFLKERAPPVVFLLLAIGPCLSGLYATEDHIDLEKFSWALVGELVSLV